ncbi:3-deoxy-D-manno-octulosonic acid transferase [Candidatus Omnitrophota bacterium]
MFLVYQLLYVIFTVCYLPIFLLRKKYHPQALMRLGIFPAGLKDKLKDKKVIWLHTVSVGEAQAAAELVKHLREQYPDFSLVISTVTKTGNKIAQRLAQPEDAVIYLPLDIGWIVKRVIKLLRPRAFIVAETEIWPNLVTNLSKAEVPIILINGRVSAGSYRGYGLVYPFFKIILDKFSLFCMQTKTDAEKIINLGAATEKVKITGNMKFDVEQPLISSPKADLDLADEQRLLIAGSTHRGEEEMVLEVYKDLVRRYQDLRLLIAPRHIERTAEVEKIVAKAGFNSQRVSELDSNLPPTTYHPLPILILDTIGQLRSLYSAAEIVFIGGSFIRHGGQNPIEPALFSKPILFGAHMSNFSDIAEVFLKNDAAIMVKNPQQLTQQCANILNDSARAKTLGQKAKQVVQRNRGTTLRNIKCIKAIISNGGG